MADINVDFKLLRGTAARWAAQNPILRAGEPGVESDTGFFRIGNGYDNWLDLEYFMPSGDVLAAIEQAIADAGVGGGGGGGVTPAQLQAHINSLTPHPAYDDGPSLVLLYQNAKV